MKVRLPALLVMCSALALGCTAPNGQGEPEVSPDPPIAAKHAEELEAHGDIRVDDYYWLRDRENPEVMAYLEAENQYTARDPKSDDQSVSTAGC